MKKKLVSAAVLSCMVVTSLAGCGGNSSTATTAAPATTAAETTAAAAETKAAEETTAAAAETTAAETTGDKVDVSSLEPVNLIIYSPGNENSVPTKTIVKYSELVKDASDGKLTLEVHSSNELGNDSEALSSTRLGDIDIVFAGTSGFTEFYDPAKIYDLPYLFKDADQAYEVTNSEVGAKVFDKMGDVGLEFLAEGDNGMRQISTTESGGPIHTAADVKGLKIRVPQSQIYTDVWTTLGANPVALALPELSMALSNGTAEGQDNATYHLVANATYDSIKYFSYINYMWMGCTMAANKDKFDSLPEQYQQILRDQAKVAAKYSFDQIKADNETGRKTLEEAGVQFDDNPDVQSFKDALGGEDFYKKYASEAWYNQELLDEILAYNK